MDENELIEETEETEVIPDDAQEEAPIEPDEREEGHTFVREAFEKLLAEVRALAAKVDALGETQAAINVESGEVIREPIEEAPEPEVPKEENPDLDDLDLIVTEKFE